MSYRRVIPRDLFNEANLLKCLAHLWIKTERYQSQSPRAVLLLHTGNDWNIHQDEADGSIRSGSITVIIRQRSYDHYRPLNSREPWPLWLTLRMDPDGDHFRAFTDEGELSPEFLALLGEGRSGIECDDDGQPICTNPSGHEWPRVEEHERCLCIHCGADGDG